MKESPEGARPQHGRFLPCKRSRAVGKAKAVLLAALRPACPARSLSHANVLCKNGAQLGRSNRSPVLPAAPVRSYVALSAPPPSNRAGTNFPTTRTQRPVPSRPVPSPRRSPHQLRPRPPLRLGAGKDALALPELQRGRRKRAVPRPVGVGSL